MHPQAKQESILGYFWLGGVDLEVGVVHLVVLDRVLRVTTKKGRQLFWRKKKCTPDEILATPMGSTIWGCLV